MSSRHSELSRVVLPIDALVPQVIETVRAHPITLLEAEPGAGKTTRVPPALLAAGFRQVLVLEPRRIATRLAARRVAEERGEAVGRTVGYKVRFEEQGSAQTALWFVTEGVLTRRFAEDPTLRGVDAVILDEFHERHLDTDIALALLRRLQKSRPELRLLLMSATLGTETLSEQLGGVPILRSPGRAFPVDVRYQPYLANPLEAQVASALSGCLGNSDGHMLVFLPGAAEIRRAMAAADGLVKSNNAQAFALHGDLTPEAQDQAVAPSTGRKVIFSTNVAESSVTIEGVRVVIDSGLARIASWSPWSGLSRLRVEKISRSSAIQRAGRAGRTAPGLAIRLYPETDFLRRAEHTLPEIVRADLSSLLLQLAAMDLQWEDLEWIDSPAEAALQHARELLRQLSALDQNGQISSSGQSMAKIPAHPRIARFALAAAQYGIEREASVIGAALSEGRIRLAEEHRNRQVSDLEAILGIELSFQTRRLQQQILRAITKRSTGAAQNNDPHALEKAVLCGHPDRVARRRGETLLLSSGGSARLDRFSAVESEFLCAIEVEERAEEGTPLVRLACSIEPDWLLELFPERIQTREQLQWNRTAERAEQVSQLLYDALVIDQSVQVPKDIDAASAMLLEKALEMGIERFGDREASERLRQRIRFAQQHLPELAIPSDVFAAALQQLACGLRSIEELKQAAADGGLEGTAEALLPMGKLDEIAPTHVRLPSGRRARIEYTEGQAPSVASRLQDFFGMTTTPTVAGGAVPLVVHLLAPNGRPVQMTRDLPSFWKTLYPQLRRELGRRYPKHKWPEDPLQPAGN